VFTGTAGLLARTGPEGRIMSAAGSFASLRTWPRGPS